MSGYEPDFFADGEWEERGELAWNEHDWQQYLKQNELDVARYLTLYLKHRASPARLDEIAHILGWDREDWSLSDEEPAAEASPWQENPQEEEPELDDSGPYTLHRHPVYIVNRALFRLLREVTEQHLAIPDLPMAPLPLWQMAGTFQAAETNAILAIQAQDMGDYTLCVCHMKNALSAINHTLSLLGDLPDSAYRETATAILFDLREVFLRVMNESREENRRRFSD